jgi:hypothetical protein
MGAKQTVLGAAHPGCAEPKQSIAVPPPDVPDLGRCARQESPACRIGPVFPGILCEDLGGVALGVHGDRHEPNLRAEVGAEPLHRRHLGGEERTRVRQVA